jgi:hypothetical protein
MVAHLQFLAVFASHRRKSQWPPTKQCSLLLQLQLLLLQLPHPLQV